MRPAGWCRFPFSCGSGGVRRGAEQITAPLFTCWWWLSEAFPSYDLAAAPVQPWFDASPNLALNRTPRAPDAGPGCRLLAGIAFEEGE